MNFHAGKGIPGKKIQPPGGRGASSPPCPPGQGRCVVPGRERIASFWGVLQGFFSGARLRRPGGQGGFRPPPFAPLDPLYPLQTAGVSPGPPLYRKGYFLLLLDRRSRGGHALRFGSGAATNRGPKRARALPGALAAACTAARYSCRSSPLPPRFYSAEAGFIGAWLSWPGGAGGFLPLKLS